MTHRNRDGSVGSPVNPAPAEPPRATVRNLDGRAVIVVTRHGCHIADYPTIESMFAGLPRDWQIDPADVEVTP